MMSNYIIGSNKSQHISFIETINKFIIKDLNFFKTSVVIFG